MAWNAAYHLLRFSQLDGMAVGEMKIDWSIKWPSKKRHSKAYWDSYWKHWCKGQLLYGTYGAYFYAATKMAKWEMKNGQ